MPEAPVYGYRFGSLNVAPRSALSCSAIRFGGLALARLTGPVFTSRSARQVTLLMGSGSVAASSLLGSVRGVVLQPPKCGPCIPYTQRQSPSILRLLFYIILACAAIVTGFDALEFVPCEDVTHN